MAKSRAERLALTALAQNGQKSVKTKNTVSAVSDIVLASGGGSASVGGKNFYQATEPTEGMLEGNLWFDIDDGNKMYNYTGSAWELSVMDENVVSIDGGKITAGTVVSNAMAAGTIDAGVINTGTLSTWGTASFTNDAGYTDDSAANSAQSTANSAYSLAGSATQPSEVANAINTNTTTINGAKITTGSISASQIDSEISLITEGYIVANGEDSTRRYSIAGNTSKVAYGGVAGYSDFGGWAGVYGSNDHATGIGVGGIATTSGRGVYGESESGHGVEGTSTSSYSGYFLGGLGVYVAGDMHVTGNLTVDGTAPGGGGGISATDYATNTTGGTVKMRVASGTLYIRNDGTNA